MASLLLLLAISVVFGLSSGFQPARYSCARRRLFDHSIASVKRHVDGPILEPSYNDPTRFDAACVANPVVLPPSNDGEKWQMYYYGNAGSWNRDITSFLPTGWCGLAESDDGICWTKIDGSDNANGAILGPSDDPNEWDAVQIGVGDVIRVPSDDNKNGGEELLHMYYFGGSSEPVGLGTMAGMELVGFRMRIGRAKSSDNGRTWTKMGVCLDFDESEGICIMAEDNTSNERRPSI